MPYSIYKLSQKWCDLCQIQIQEVAMSLKLRGIDFGSVVVASGTLNFFGQGWPYHDFYKMVPGFSFNGATLITKTTTLTSRGGNMPLDEHFQPKEFRPKCIYVDFLKGLALNAVGLSGPGAIALFNEGSWSHITKPFIISFMSVNSDKGDRLDELVSFCELLKVNNFRSKFALEINISCPNTQHNPVDLIDEAIELVNTANNLLGSVPIIIKISILIDSRTIKKVVDNSPCDAIDVSNTVPFGQLPEVIDWQKLFGTIESPLKQFGGGGLSGKPIFPLVADYINRLRNSDVNLPLIGGGGVFSKADCEVLRRVGADAVSIGTVAMLRPWRVQGIINYANTILRRGL